MAEPTLEYLPAQQVRILDELRTVQRRTEEEIASLRDDMRVIMGMMQRFDGAVQGLLTEVRAEHSRYDRLERRVRALEENR